MQKNLVIHVHVESEKVFLYIIDLGMLNSHFC